MPLAALKSEVFSCRLHPEGKLHLTEAQAKINDGTWQTLCGRKVRPRRSPRIGPVWEFEGQECCHWCHRQAKIKTAPIRA